MTVALIMDFPGMGRSDYDEVVRLMGIDRMANGGRLHVAGATPDGWRVIDVWEDMASFERFRDSQLGPTSAQAGVPRPEVRVVEVEDEMTGAGEATFAQIVTMAGMDADAFHRMHAEVVPGGEPPDGLVWHFNGPIDGGWCVIDSWVDQAARDRFIEARVMPAMQAAGAAGPPRIEDQAIAATMAGAAHTTA